MKRFIIKSDRIGFSIWEETDLKEALELWGNSNVTKYITADGKMSIEDVKTRLKVEIEFYEKYKVQYWPIFLNETSENLGVCGLHPYNIKDSVFELGVHLREKYWGIGVAEKACNLVMRYAFENLQAKAIFVGHNPNNKASKKLIKKLGFTYTHDEFYEPTGLYHPSYLITCNEFIEVKNKLKGGKIIGKNK